MPSVAIIGAGLAGLVAAYELSKHGFDVLVFEATDRIGGVIQSIRKDGYLLECGPNTIQSRGDVLDRLIDELKLEGEIIEASPAAKKRYVVRSETAVPVPASPPALLTSRLFSTSAKLRLLREPFLHSTPVSDDETVADFVRRRLGEEILDYAVNPFVAGIYAGDPEELSIQHVFPSMYELEQQYGSLLKGQIRKMRVSRSNASPARKRRMFSFREGLRTLPRALSSRLGDSLRLDCKVTSIGRAGDEWNITYEHMGKAVEQTTDVVLWASPLHSLSDVDIETWIDLSPLRDAVYAPVSVVALGFPAEAVTHPLDGFGILVPEREKSFQILGALFSSTLFPDRAPEGHVLLTTFVGGQRYPHLVRLSDESLIRTAQQDLERLLGIHGEPDFTNIVRWERAIPQYRTGYGAVKQAIDRLEQEHRGLYMAGSFRAGVSVGDTAATAAEVSRRIIEAFS